MPVAEIDQRTAVLPKNADMPTTFESEWRARFDRFASRGGSDAVISGWSEHGLERRMHVLACAMADDAPARGGIFLDIGCGSGVYCKWLATEGYHVVGADYSLGMTKRAAENTRGFAADGKIHIAVADIYHPPFKSGSFDGLINVGVLQHLADAETAVASMAGLVKTGGLLYLDTLNPFSFHAVASFLLDLVRGWMKGRFLPKRHAVRRRPGRLFGYARSAGLEPIVVKGVYILPKGFHWLEKLLDRLDGVHWPFTVRPIFLPWANAYLAVFRQTT